MTTTPTPKRPWRRRIVTRPRPDVVVASGTPLAQLTIYTDHLLLARRRRSGAWMQYPVTPEAVAQALGDLPRSSGLLPPGTIAAGSVHGKPFLVRWRPPGTYTLRTERQLYTIPMPPLVWAGCGTEYRIFALGAEGREWPTDLRAPLYAAPMPNTYATGTICWGSSEARPEASPAGLARAWKVFEESAFNTHVANGKSKAFPNNVMTQWNHLLDAGAESYPLDDLEPTRYTLSWLCSGDPWTGEAR